MHRLLKTGGYHRRLLP